MPVIEILEKHIETNINTEVILFKNTFEGKTDYRVRLKDLDVNEVVGGIHIFTNLEKAKDCYTEMKDSLNPNYIFNKDCVGKSYKKISIPVW